MRKSAKFSPEVQARAVRMVLEHQNEHSSQWAAIESISAKFGCTAETLRRWVRQAECDQGSRQRVFRIPGAIQAVGEVMRFIDGDIRDLGLRRTESRHPTS